MPCASSKIVDHGGLRLLPIGSEEVEEVAIERVYVDKTYAHP